MRYLLAAFSACCATCAEGFYWIGDRFKAASEWAEGIIHDIDIRKLKGRR